MKQNYEHYEEDKQIDEQFEIDEFKRMLEESREVLTNYKKQGKELYDLIMNVKSSKYHISLRRMALILEFQRESEILAKKHQVSTNAILGLLLSEFHETWRCF